MIILQSFFLNLIHDNSIHNKHDLNTCIYLYFRKRVRHTTCQNSKLPSPVQTIGGVQAKAYMVTSSIKHLLCHFKLTNKILKQRN